DVGIEMKYCVNCQIDDNEVYDSGGDTQQVGIYVRNVDPSTVNGNTIYGHPGYGIDARNLLDVVFDGNVIYLNDDHGLYLCDSEFVNITDNNISQNGDVAGGYGIRCYQSDDVEINDNQVGDNDAYGVYLDGCDDAMVDSNYIFGSSTGLYLTNADYAAILDNHIYDNTVYGFYVESGSSDAVVTGNRIYDNHDGAFIDSDGGYYSGNLVYDQTGYGMYFMDADGMDFLNNQVYGNGDYGVFLDTCTGNTFEGNTLYSNGYNGYYVDDASDDNTFTDDVLYDNGFSCSSWDPECYGLYMFDSLNNELTNVVSRDSWGGMWLESVDAPVLTDVSIYGNTEDALYFTDATNIDMTRVHLYNNGGYGFYFESSSNGMMTDCRVNDNGPGIYGIELYDSSAITTDGLLISNQPDSYLYVENGSTLDNTNLTIGYNHLYGVTWPAVTIFDVGQSTDLHDGNFLLQDTFVSLNSTDPNAAELNVSAVITTRVEGCSNLQYYHAAGFPADAAEIMATGATFTPVAPACDGALATYDAQFGFSGYTAIGALSPGGGAGGDDDTKRLTVSSELVCPDDTVEFTVTRSSSPVAGVEVSLTQYFPYAGTIDTGTTDSDGKVSFSLPVTGEYRAYFSKSGYSYANPYGFEHTLCGGAVGCTVDSDCATTESCVGGTCVAVTGECGHASGHVWIDYECCADSDCAEGTTCVDHVCMSPEEEVHEEAPEEGETPPEEVAAEEEPNAAAAALEALDEATGAIWKADQEGKDTSAAKAKFQEAQDAYNAGDYAKAKELAEEAKRLADEAAAPAPGETPEAGVEEMPGAPAEQPPPSGGGPDIVLIIVGLVILGVLGAGAYWLLKAKK
ncbi:MAG TPA: hypothetical protein EYP34_15025, partial [Chromatiaceae bacterium]|nr:hypothetical protein [Chromatiaceae bacterium]